MKFLALTIFINLISFSGIAATKYYRGSSAVVCRQNGKIFSAELLDFFEARVLRNENIMSFPSHLKFEEILEDRISVFSKIAPLTAEKYQKELDKILTDKALFLNGAEIRKLAESNYIAAPKGCQVEQVATQQLKTVREDKPILFSNEIWSSMSELQKAGLVMNQLLQRMGPGDKSYSNEYRYLNWLIFSPHFEQLNDLQWAKVSSRAVPTVDVEAFGIIFISTWHREHNTYYKPQITSTNRPYVDDYGNVDVIRRNLYERHLITGANWATFGDIFFPKYAQHDFGFHGYNAIKYRGKKYFVDSFVVSKGEVISVSFPGRDKFGECTGMRNITGPIEEVIKYYDFRCRKGRWALSFPDSVTKMLSDALDGRITEGVLPGR